MEYVAEISGNHQGKKELALKLIEQAAEAGATAVKFQLFDPEALAKKRIANPVMERPDIKGNWDTATVASLTDLYRQTWTPLEWFPELATTANSCGIDWFASVFSAQDVINLALLGCKTMKISAFEWADPDILRPAMTCSNDRLIMSVRGEVPDREIRRVLDIAQVEYRPSPKITLLHATDYGAADDLLGMARLRKFGVPFGLSDHTPCISTALAACAAGATMIERHICWEDDTTSPDHSFSSTPEEFKKMVEMCNGLDAVS